MENNSEGIVNIVENPDNPASPFYGTPWSSDDEIYDYVIQRKYVDHWDWENVKESLMMEGLDGDYADAIIAYLQVEGKKAKKSVRLKGTLEVLLALVIGAVGIYIVFFDQNYELTHRGYIIWLVGTISLLIHGFYKLNRKF